MEKTIDRDEREELVEARTRELRDPVEQIQPENTGCRRAEEELRNSEAKYRSLFESIEEGFCIIEVIFDEQDKPVDCRFLDINPAFERQTGLINACGRRMRELAHGQDEHWFDIYGRIARTGQPIRFEHRAAQLHRWYDVYAWRYGDPQNRQVAILFNDITERKHAEETLREREAKYRAAIEASGNGFCITDMAGRFLEFNDAYVKLLGYSREELLTMSVSDVEAQFTAAEITATMEKVKSEGRIIFETKHRSRDGRVWPAELNLSYWPIADGRMFVFLRDITERKRAEDELRQSEERLRLAQQVARIGTFEWDIQTGVNTWTPELERLYGLPPGGFVRTQPAWEDLIYQEDRLETLRRVQRALDTGEPMEGEWRVVRPDGRIRWVAGRWQMIKDESGKPLRMIGVNIDITERKQAENALRESEAGFRSLFDNMTEGVALHEIIYDDRHTAVDYRILAVNPAYSVQTGLHPDQVQGKLASTAYGQGEAPFLATYARVAETGQSISFEAFFEPLGRHFHISATSPKPGHFVTVFEDITKWKMAEEKLRRTQEELEQRVQERTADLESAYGMIKRSEEDLRYLAARLLTAQEMERKRVSYELHDNVGQSLTVLKMQLRIVEKHLAGENKAKEELKLVLNYLNQIIEAVRHISKGLSPTLLEDLGLVKALKHLFEETCKRQDIKCTLHMDDIDSLLSLEAQINLYRIFQEILNNVVKHGRADRIELNIRKLETSINFWVTDNGVGFDVEETLASRTKDRGLGLTSLEERTRMMGGSFTIESKKGGGTTININVPFSGDKLII